jgi:hypothetical protein
MPIGVNSLPKTYKSWANGYKALIDTAYKKGKDYRQGLFFMDSTENWEDRLVEIGTTGGMSKWDAGDRANQSDIKEGYDKRFVQTRFGEEVPIGTLAEKFQGMDVRLTRRASTGIGKDAYLLEQKAAFSWINYGFSDTNTYLTGVLGSTVSALGPDGKRFFSTLHPCSPTNSTTWSNALSDNAEVGEDALKAMIENLHNQLDDQGEKKQYGEEGYIWIVPLEQYPEAKRTVGGDLRPNTDTNDINVYKGAFDGRPIEVRWVPWLSNVSTTAHYLIARDAVEEENLVVLNSMEFYIDDYVDDTTDTAYVRGRNIFVTGFVSGRGVVGSQGTGTGTYTA